MKTQIVLGLTTLLITGLFCVAIIKVVNKLDEEFISSDAGQGVVITYEVMPPVRETPLQRIDRIVRARTTKVDGEVVIDLP